MSIRIMTIVFATLTCLVNVTMPPFAADAQAQIKKITFPSGQSLPVTFGADKKGQEYFDPHGSGNPLLDVGGVHGSKSLSKNFKASEFARSGKNRFTKVRIDPKLVKCLQMIRDHVGKPVVINSGYRSYLYNKKIYEAKGQRPTKSRHISGQAADIRIKGMTGLEIAKTALKVCGTHIGVGIGLNYAHIDVREKYARWTYFTGEKDRATIRAVDLFRRGLLMK